MSKTVERIGVSMTVRTPEHLPVKDGEQMYSDDVASEVRDVVQCALDSWYRERGRLLLVCEPMVW